MKVYVSFGEESYPVRGLSKEKHSGYPHEAEMTEEQVTWIEHTMAEYEKVQDLLEEIANRS